MLVTYKDIIREAGHLFKVNHQDIHSKYRYRFLMPARFAVWTALHLRKTSYSQIGRWFERDHTTIIHGVNVAKRKMETDHDYKTKVLTLKNLGGKI